MKYAYSHFYEIDISLFILKHNEIQFKEVLIFFETHLINIFSISYQKRVSD